MKRILAIYLVLVSMLCAAPSKKAVLEAIDEIESGSGDFRSNAQILIRFAAESEEVQIEISKERTPWMEEMSEKEDRDGIFLTLYVAGIVKHQLETKSTDDDPYYGWAFMLPIYEKIWRPSGYQSAALDRMLKMQQEDRLRDHADKIN